jgi:3-methyladenine DNA glycosylase/8-oxoguanine DNA glycosylase
MAGRVAEFEVLGRGRWRPAAGSGEGFTPAALAGGRTLAEVSQAWRPYRTRATVHLRALREQRTGEIAGR